MRALQPDLEEVSSWRFCRAQIVSRRGVWVPIFRWTHSFGAYILIGAEILTSALFLSYLMWRSNFTIPHSFAPYICCLYLPPIFATYIWDIRLYFDQAPIFYACANILSKRQYLMIFAISFCLILLLQIFAFIFSVFIYAFLCAPIFSEQLF
jgi:hypothetical protein